MSMEQIHKTFDLVCFSHLGYNNNHRRPEQLLLRFAKFFRTFEIEETIFNANSDRYDITLSPDNVVVAALHLQGERTAPDAIVRQQKLLEKLFLEEKITDYIFWYYTPMALSISRQLTPLLVVYDCIAKWPENDLEIAAQELELFTKADLVFTDGQCLYENNRKYNLHTYSFPSSIDFDKEHFPKSNALPADPPDQDSIPHPRIGFHGVFDERFDVNLMEELSRMRPEWQFVMIGPLIKMEASRLSHFHNIYYLGAKRHDELPAYFTGWDVAIIPFLPNKSIYPIAPKNILEYLAAGIPVVSAPIDDPILAYNTTGIIQVADSPGKFIQHIEQELLKQDRTEWLEKTERLLADYSWDSTWKEMMKTICTVTKQKINYEVEKLEWVNTAYVL